MQEYIKTIQNSITKIYDRISYPCKGVENEFSMKVEKTKPLMVNGAIFLYIFSRYFSHISTIVYY